MLCGAVLGWLIVSSALHLLDTARHTGPGIVHYGDGDRSPERSKEVFEGNYKRHNYVMSGMMLSLGLFLWVVVAKTARTNAAKAEAKEDYLASQMRRATAYHQAFASTLDDVTRTRAAAEAQLSTEFQDAREDEQLAARIYYAAAKAAKGDSE